MSPTPAPPSTGRLLAAAVAALLLAPASAAQELNRYGIFLDKVDVNIINIDVMVVDKDGNPVRGLTLDDFELYEDGEPIEISNFFAVEQGARVLPPALPTPAPETGDGATPAVPTSPLPAPRNERFVALLIDNGNIAGVNRKRVFDQLREDLGRLMGPADHVMVVSQDGGFHIEQTFTHDPEKILAAIDGLEKVTGRGDLRYMESRLIQREIEGGDAPQGSDVLASGGGAQSQAGNPFQQIQGDVDARTTFTRVSGHAQTVLTQTRQTVVELSRFIETMAGLPGRKAIVYVSDGLELSPGEFLFRLWDFKYSAIGSQVGVANIDTEIQRYDLTDDFQDLIANANANRVAFYTVEGGSERGFGDVTAEQHTALTDSLARSADGGREESLRALAYETGGVPAINDAGVESLLAQLDKDFNSYYSLGYPSPHSGDGKYHRVEVKVRREGVQVRYLEGYQDKSSDDRMSDRTLAALLHDVDDNPLDVEVEVGERQRKVRRGKGFVVPVMVKIPLARLVLIPQDDAYLGRLSIFLAVRDEQGRLVEPRKIDVPVRIPEEQFQAAIRQKAGYAAELQLRAGDQRIAIGVRDELAAVDSTLNLNLRVGKL